MCARLASTVDNSLGTMSVISFSDGTTNAPLFSLYTRLNQPLSQSFCAFFQSSGVKFGVMAKGWCDERAQVAQRVHVVRALAQQVV
jgi:hypothetical protein